MHYSSARPSQNLYRLDATNLLAATPPWYLQTSVPKSREERSEFHIQLYVLLVVASINTVFTSTHMDA